jgi:homoserine dehydrogenase
VVGETFYHGAGAGRLPTASAVLADLIDLAAGRAQKTFQALRLWPANAPGPDLRPAATVRSRFYLRLLVQDRPGVLADVSRALANEEISIASVIQHEALEEHEGAVVPLVIMTHEAPTGRFRAALRAIDLLPSVAAAGVYYPVAE